MLDSQDSFKKDYANWRELQMGLAPWPYDEYSTGKMLQSPRGGPRAIRAPDPGGPGPTLGLGESNMKAFVRVMDAFTDRLGRFLALLMLPLSFVVVYEVVLRKVFMAPTIWGFEMTVYIYGIHLILSAAYALMKNAHVRIDVVMLLFSERKRAIFDLACYFLIFIPFVGGLCWGTFDFAIESWFQWERSDTAWKPPLYP